MSGDMLEYDGVMILLEAENAAVTSILKRAFITCMCSFRFAATGQCLPGCLHGPVVPHHLTALPFPDNHDNR